MISPTALTAFDVLSIPSWASKITIVINSIAVAAAAQIIFKLGKLGEYATGISYEGWTENMNSAVSGSAWGSGIEILNGTAAQTEHIGTITLIRPNVNVNDWVVTGIVYYTAGISHLVGKVTMNGDLAQIRLTTETGTVNFTNKDFSVRYE